MWCQLARIELSSYDQHLGKLVWTIAQKPKPMILHIVREDKTFATDEGVICALYGTNNELVGTRLRALTLLPYFADITPMPVHIWLEKGGETLPEDRRETI